VEQQPRFAEPARAAGQPTERLEFRKPPPTCEQAVRELGLEGQAVDCEEPSPPTYDPPQMHGSYRLIPATYVGPLTYRDDSAPVFPTGVVSDNAAVLKASPLYRQPAWLPEGYVLQILRTGNTGSQDTLAARYDGPGQPISITWVHHYTWPIDVILPRPDSALTLEAIVVGDKEGILWYPKAASSGASHLTTALSYVEGNVEISVMGEGLNPDTAKQIARSIACEPSCLGADVLHVPEDTVSDTKAPGGGPSAPAALSTTTQFPTEHRVIAGLGITNVSVSYHPDVPGYWHGSSYGEAALDLTNPNGGTENTNVYFISWPWNGGGTMNATTENYYTYDPVYNPNGSHCTGRYVLLKDAAQNVLGRLTYVHLTNQAPPGDSWPTNPNTWTIRFLGTPATSQEDGCDFHGAHLHQGMTTASPKVWYNTAIPDSQGRINPTNPEPPTYNWIFRVIFNAPEDWDGDGCTDVQEVPPGAGYATPGARGGFDPHNYWDLYDVPVPANSDPAPNGPRNRAVNVQDVVGVLKYVGTFSNGPSNGKVDYDSLKDGDWNGDTVMNDYDKVGLRYDRSPSPGLNPPWDAGPPSGAINVSDVVTVLHQVGISCIGGQGAGAGASAGSSAGGGSALLSAPNAMAVDAIPGGGIDAWRWWLGGTPFDMDVVVSAAAAPYAGYDLALSYDHQVLEFIPTADLDGDMAAESWTYTGLGGMGVNATVTGTDLDADTVADAPVGGSARSSGTTTATGAAVTARFRCIANGTSAVHLVTTGESVFGTTTIDDNAALIETSLADAGVSCFGFP
jgi:hypothetical protein